MKRFNLLTAVFAALLFSTFAFAADDGNFAIGIATGLPAIDTAINLSNSGASWGSNFGGVVSNGNICANVYVFTSDEQEEACCACNMSPNSLHSFAASELIGNPLTPVSPSSIVIKIVATANTTGTCNPANANAAPLLAPGLTVWGRRGPNGSDVPFIPATLSAKELQRITNLCSFIVQNGTNAGICKSCALGGI